MDVVQIKITTTAVTARYGTLSTGDILRTDAAFARHLVVDCRAAVYDHPEADEVDAPDTDGDELKPDVTAEEVASPVTESSKKKGRK